MPDTLSLVLATAPFSIAVLLFALAVTTTDRAKDDDNEDDEN